MTRFIQLCAIREEGGDTLYTLDDAGTVWTYWTGRGQTPQWNPVPEARAPITRPQNPLDTTAEGV
jgi:hypothetical protein